MKCVILSVAIASLLASPVSNAVSDIVWDRAIYWDDQYPTCWTSNRFLRDAFEYAGYKVLNADQLRTWMLTHIADSELSVVVFCRDIAPETVIESASSNCTLRQYLNAGGKIVWYSDIPMYYQGHPDGSRTNFGVDGATKILGFNPASGTWNSQDQVTFTTDGLEWGLTETWQSQRPTSGSGLCVLARDSSGYTAAWVKHYLPDDTYRGFVRLFDRPGKPNFHDVHRAAEYPNVPEMMSFDSEAESKDDIVAVFYYPWYRNPTASGYWRHWKNASYSPPAKWAAFYIPSYPNSTWNPDIQLYDSSDTELLRWQDIAMARTGIDIAVASWWGIGGYEDEAFAKAIRTCKSVQWCVYYEPEGYGDPAPLKISNDIKYILDTYGPTGNYARIDGKWLILVYVAGGEDAANRWQQAKELLAADGYSIYLNGDMRSTGAATAPNPWDAIHRYSPIVYEGLTDTFPDMDDSAWISPGFWKVPEQSPRLEHSLSEFTSAWNSIVDNRKRFRFIFIETWNEWHEGSQIEPGQEIIPDPAGYYPSGYDYGYDFIDAIGPSATFDLHWTTSGHRPAVPVRLEAEKIIWDDDSKIELSKEDPNEVIIREKNVRIGSSIFLPQMPDSNELIITVRAKSTTTSSARLTAYPQMTLYLDNTAAGQWEIPGTIPQQGTESAFQDYSAVVYADKGIHKVELAMTYEPGDWDLMIDFIDVNAIFMTDDSDEPRKAEFHP